MGVFNSYPTQFDEIVRILPKTFLQQAQFFLTTQDFKINLGGVSVYAYLRA